MTIDFYATICQVEKQCTKCGCVKPLASFSRGKRYADGLQTQCKDCNRAYYLEHREERIAYVTAWVGENRGLSRTYKERHREKHKVDVLLSERNRRRQRRKDALAYLGGRCVSCGSVDRLEIDHIDPSSVSFRFHGAITWERLRVELDKCQLLCKPCHQDKTARQIATAKGCAGCGQHLDDRTVGCYPCKKRHEARRRRASG